MTTGGKPRLLGISKRGNKYLRKLVTAAAFDKGSLYRILRNRVYIGLAVHKGVAYPGEHRAIISQTLWDKPQSILRESPRMRACRSRAALAAGISASQRSSLPANVSAAILPCERGA